MIVEDDRGELDESTEGEIEARIIEADRGDSIADQHGITAVGLAKANPGVPDWTKLTDGQHLLIPAH